MKTGLTGNEVRQMFLDFFTSKDHMIEPGASLIPKDDPTLLWINAGVAPLKKYFDGSQKPQKNRITNVQKSIRTNDIENVGKTARHHTFFEMLGNFSIGDYFKSEAIPFAWEFLTSDEWLGIDKDRLYISVYKDDDEAYRIWTEVCGVDPKRILKTEDNFWEIGKGPGGPDTEIFFDRGEKYDPEGLGEKLFFDEMENDRYVEVWNVVFSQYDCDPEKDRREYQELPQKNIDTGMGLERLVALLQDAETNFDTDLFLPIIEATEKMAREPYSSEKMAYRVIADHIRTLVFALSDGAAFSNSGRGYVLRRLLRRAARYGLRIGIEGSFLSDLVPSVIEAMGTFYPEIAQKKEAIQKQISREEESFRKTLFKGYELLDQAMEEAEDGMISGEQAFRLYDTYGFPFELTEEIALEKGYSVDRNGFEREMQAQKERARNARNVEESFASQHRDIMEFTDANEFIGYDVLRADGTILAIFQDGRRVESLEGEGEIIVDPTVFYALSGGQVADQGWILAENAKARVVDVRKSRNDQHLIHVVMEDGVLFEGEKVEQVVDLALRRATTSNHSATHLLQSALREVLQSAVEQKGSYVGPDYLRFDFSYPEKLSEEQLEAVEALINEMIAQAHPVTKEVLPIDEAKKKGAIALFDEKYGDMVRVVTMGDVSMEFCGGCHVDNTAEIGVCHIVSEESIGSNIRRITAKTGLEAWKDFHSQEKMLQHIARSSRSKNIRDLDERVDRDYDSYRRLQKEHSDLENQLAQLRINGWMKDAREVDGVRLLVRCVRNESAKMLKEQLTRLKKENPDLVAIVASLSDDRASLLVAAGKEAVEKGADAGAILREIMKASSGKGGGKKDLAQGGTADQEALQAALERISSMDASAISLG